MKRSVIHIVIICYFAVLSSNSIQMYSIEAGMIYTESYNINHLLDVSSLDCGNPFTPQKDPISQNQDYSHFHIIEINFQAFDRGNGLNIAANIQPISFPPHLHNNLHISQVQPLSDFYTKLKILPLGYSNLRHSPVLLI